MAVTCPSCLANGPDNGRFCRNCGSRLTRSLTAASAAEQQHPEAHVSLPPTAAAGRSAKPSPDAATSTSGRRSRRAPRATPHPARRPGRAWPKLVGAAMACAAVVVGWQLLDGDIKLPRAGFHAGAPTIVTSLNDAQAGRAVPDAAVVATATAAGQEATAASTAAASAATGVPASASTPSCRRRPARPRR